MSFRKIITYFLAYAVFAGSLGFKFYRHLCPTSDREEIVLTQEDSCCGGGSCSDEADPETSDCCSLKADYLKISEASGLHSFKSLPDIAFVTASYKSLFLRFPLLEQSEVRLSLSDRDESPPRKYGFDFLTSIGTLLV